MLQEDLRKLLDVRLTVTGLAVVHRIQPATLFIPLDDTWSLSPGGYVLK